MRNSTKTLFLLSTALLVILAACNNGNKYKPFDEGANLISTKPQPIDSAFISAITANDTASFATNSLRLKSLYYELVAPEDSATNFNPQTPYNERQDTVLFFMQDYLMNYSRFEESMKIGKVLLERTSASPFSDIRCETFNVLAIASFRMGNIDDAIKYQEESYKIDRKNNNAEYLSSDLNQLAGFSLQAGKTDLARDYIIEAIKIEETLDRDNVLAIRYGMASEIFLKLKDLNTATDYANKALILERKANRLPKVGIRLSQLAAIQIEEGNTEKASLSLNEAIPLLEQSGNITSLAIAYCQLGQIALKQNNYSHAEQYYYESLMLCKKTGNRFTEKRALQGLWQSMKVTNPALGANYLEKYSALSDSLNSEEANSKLTALKGEYENRELILDNERLTAESRNSRFIFILFCIVIILTIVIAFIIVRNRSIRQELMKKMEQVRLNFFTNITHEFRTPLTVIIGASRELEKDDYTREQGELITNESLNLLHLVNQLLDISKINSSIGNAEWRHGNVIGYMNMLIESMRPLADSNNIEVVFAPSTNNIKMDFVPDYIKKIIHNLLSNAIKYSSADSRILMSARIDGKSLIFRIADNGKGIAKDDLAHIFDIFYQGTNSSTAIGTGVGLSLVKLLVEAMDGSITVQSKVGVGSVFSVTLPLKHKCDNAIMPFETEKAIDDGDTRTAAPAKIQEQHADHEADHSRPVILIVEDNANVVNYMAARLGDGYDIHVAHNGEEGLKRAENIIPDLIITDIMMPVMDGIEMCRRIKDSELLNYIPIIIVTAKATDSDRINGINCGADAYIHKPFNADELNALTRHLIRQRRLLCEKYRTLAISERERNAELEAADRDFINKLISIVYHLISIGEKTDIAAVAARMKMPDRSLTRKIQALTGETSLAFINRIKIDKAKNLLNSSNNDSLGHIAELCGFDDQAYFSRIFKQVTGESPTSYKRRLR